MPTFSEQTTKFPALFVLLQWKGKIFDPQLKAKIVRWLKVNKQALEIRFCDFRCSADEVSCLKMMLNESASLRKTLISIITMTVSPCF